MPNKDKIYRGRFAPSPTGPLHFGSMATAVASYLEAKTNNGKWLIRIDDLDKPRCVQGIDKNILDTLEASGMHWDESVAYQSKHDSYYEDALNSLKTAEHVYACGCTRKEILDIATTGADGPIYPGTCRNGLPKGKSERSTRVKCPNEPVRTEDRIQDDMQQDLASEVGDFIVKRADGLFAYQLAVVVDDHIQGITDVVRGSDLMDSTPRQTWLQQALGYSTPGYAHIPVATYPDGRKLSKQTFARPVESGNILTTLVRAMDFLGQQPQEHLAEGNIDDFWGWALQNWDISRIPARRNIAVDEEPVD